MPSERDNRDRDEDEEAEEELGEAHYKTQRDAVIFAIDVSRSMLKKPTSDRSKKADTDSPLTAALECAYQFMQQRIIAQPKDKMGIMFFGTKKSRFRESGSQYEHCYMYIDLDVPAAEDVKALKDLVNHGEDPDGALEPAENPGTSQVQNVLFCANQAFATSAPTFGSRRLFIITDNDVPHRGSKEAKSSAAIRAKDLYDLGVTIDLFPIRHEGMPKFELSKFYDDIIYRDPVEDSGLTEHVKTSKSGDGLTLLKSLISNINSKKSAKRSVFSGLPFEIAPGLIISVKGYLPLHKQAPARTCFIHDEGEKKLLAQGETVKQDSATHKTLDKTEVRKAYKFGQELKIHFTPEEQDSIKKFGDPCLRIVGFKSRSALPAWASIKRSIFIFPSEAQYVGSTRTFIALWTKLLDSEKFALAWFIARKNAAPLLVAILPSKPPDDPESKTPYLPAGLWLYPLSFADDLRDVRASETPSCHESLIDKMRIIVEMLQLPKAMYHPERYPNPALQWHYKILQTMALEEEIPEAAEDLTMPKYRQIHKRVGGYMENWKAELDKDVTELREMRAIKREAVDDADERPAKRAKSSVKARSSSKKLAGALKNAQLKLAADDGMIGKMLVGELKDILTSKGISTAGRKAELVDRLEQWVEENL